MGTITGLQYCLEQLSKVSYVESDGLGKATYEADFDPAKRLSVMRGSIR